MKRRGWVNCLSAGPHTEARGFGFFTVDMELSPEGLDHTDEIMKLFFQYIKMLHDVGPQEWIHREVEGLNKVHFRFQVNILIVHVSLFSILQTNYVHGTNFFNYGKNDYSQDNQIGLIKQQFKVNVRFVI